MVLPPVRQHGEAPRPSARHLRLGRSSSGVARVRRRSAAAAPGQGHGQARKASRGTLGWLIGLYLQSPSSGDRPATRKQRLAMLEGLAPKRARWTSRTLTLRRSRTTSTRAAQRRTWRTSAWAVSNLFDWATRETLPDPVTGETVPISRKTHARGEAAPDTEERGPG